MNIMTSWAIRIGVIGWGLVLAGCGSATATGTGSSGGSGATDGGGGAAATDGGAGASGASGASGAGGTSGTGGSGAAGGSDAGTPSCSDGVKNGDETGVDCGGSCPKACSDGGGCKVNGDCTSGSCQQGICQAPTCTDGVKNGKETGADCGGPTCPKCGDGSGCATNSDCASNVCDPSIHKCVPATCKDGVKNGTETDVDCGGSCPPCADKHACNTGADCQSGVCTGNVCQTPTCKDGVKNGGETDVDCGGSTCPGCGVGSTCKTWKDCSTQGCINGLCVIPCAAGTLQCNGKVAQVCDGHGGFSKTTDCAAASKVCASALGCVTCLPGTGSCKLGTATYCKSDGSGYATEVCDPKQGMTCNKSTGRCDGACAPAVIGKSYQGCDYFPTVTANAVNNAFHFAVAVSNTTATQATVTVTRGATTIATRAVAPKSVTKINLPWIASLKGPPSISSDVPFPASVRANASAYRLRSTQPVTVYQFNPLEYKLGTSYSYTNDASLLLPTNAWGSSYRVVARHKWEVFSGFVAVTAAQNGTVVTFTKGPQSGQFKPGVPGINTSGVGKVTLNTGDVVELVSSGSNSYSDPNDPTGLLVSSSKPVQVIGGHQCTFIPDNKGWCDHLEESLFPIQTLSKKYVVVAPRLPSSANPKVEMVRIVATQAGTTLSYDPAVPGAPASIAKAGGWVEIKNNASSFMITANHSVYVMQYMEGQTVGGGSGDPAMAQAVTPAQYRTTYLFHAPTNYSSNFVNIIAPAGTTVKLDGANVGGFTAIGASGYSRAVAKLSNAGTGDHTVAASAPVGVSVYGYGQYTSYWYPGGLDLHILPQQ